MEASNLILTDHKAEEDHDQLLAALTDLAYTNEHSVPSIQKSKYKSRFFFRLSKSIAREVQQSIKIDKPKAIEHIDAQVTARLKTYKKQVPKELTTNINEVREFFLTVIGPRTLAGGAGAIQARDIVQRLLGSEIDGSQFDKFERMSHEAVNIVMAKFVASYYGLSARSATKILASIMPRTPVTVPIPQVYESRHAKARREKEEKKDTAAK